MGTRLRNKTSERCSLLVKLKKAKCYTGNLKSTSTIGKLFVYNNFFHSFVDHVIGSWQQTSLLQTLIRETASFISLRPSMFPQYQLLFFVIPPNLKVEEKLQKKKCSLDAGLHTNLPWFQGAWHDHIGVESSSCCFPRKLVSFDSEHITHSFAILENVFEVGGITMIFITLELSHISLCWPQYN